MTSLALFNAGFEGTLAETRAMVRATPITGVTQSTQAANVDTGTKGAVWTPSTTSLAAQVAALPLAGGTQVPSERGEHTFGLALRSTGQLADHRVTLRIRHYDASGVLLNETAANAPGARPVTGAYQRFTVTAPPVTGTASVEATAEVVLTADTGAAVAIDTLALDVTPQAAPLTPDPTPTTPVRQALADAASTVSTVNCVPYMRQSTKPGDGFVRLERHSADDTGFGFMTSWLVVIALPQDAAAAEKWIDANVSALFDALADEGSITNAEPVTLTVENSGSVPAFVITIIRSKE